MHMAQRIRSPRTLLGTVLGTLGLTLALSVSSAFAATGNNGTVKVHDSTTGTDTPRNEPHVCEFYLAFFFSDPAESGDWEILAWNEGTVVASGTYLTDADGFYRTSDMTLDDGHYRVNWQGMNDTSWKHKMFWVDCVDEAAQGAQGAGGAPAAPEAQGGAQGAGGAAAPQGGVQAGQGGPGGGGLPDTAMPPPEPNGGLAALAILLVTVATAAVHRLRTEVA